MRAIRKKDGFYFQLSNEVFDEKGNDYTWDEVDLVRERNETTCIINPVTDIDWEQRRYEIAKEAFPFVSKLTTDIFRVGQKVEGSAGKTIMQVCAEKTLLYTDALIEELKKEK